MISANALLTRGLESLRSRLPPTWSADVAEGGTLCITAPDGRTATLTLSPHLRLDPRRAEQLVASAPRGERPVLALAPWMSPDTRTRLVAAGLHLLDLTGGVCLSLAEPGLYLEAPSAPRDPWPEPSRVTLRGARAAAVVVALCQVPLPVGVRQLAAEAEATPGYTSKLLAMLDARAVLHRSPRGGVARIELLGLLETWAEDSPLSVRTRATSWQAPKGLTDFLTRLSRAETRYAITGRLGAWLYTSGTPPRGADLYAEDPEALAALTGLRPASIAGTVNLLAPRDPGVFAHTGEADGMALASVPRMAADLLSGPDRSTAEALIEWMNENPAQWRSTYLAVAAT